MKEADRGRLLRSVLFFPGSRPELLVKAAAAGADAVCVDLEDGVAPDRKADARAAVVELLSGRLGAGRDGSDGRAPGAVGTTPAGPERDTAGRAAVFVRINHPGADTGRLDLDALADPALHVDGVLIPKVERPDAVRRVEEALGDPHPRLGLVPMVETARGLAEVEAVVAATERILGLAFGGLDLSADLGADGGWESLLHARSRVVHAAALARTGAVDAPFMDLADRDGLVAEARRARGLGFTGKLAVHPRQIEAIHEAYTPTPEEAERARRIVEAYEEAGEGVAVVDGRVVDRPVVTSARRILALARESRSGG